MVEPQAGSCFVHNDFAVDRGTEERSARTGRYGDLCAGPTMIANRRYRRFMGYSANAGVTSPRASAKLDAHLCFSISNEKVRFGVGVKIVRTIRGDVSVETLVMSIL